MQKLMSEVTEMILTLPNKIYISSANVDMRKSIDGLVSIVEDSFNGSMSIVVVKKIRKGIDN